MSSTTAGSHGSTMDPKTRNATARTTISVANETRNDSTVETTSTSRRNHVFLMRFAFARSDSMPPVTPFDTNVHGSRPQSRNRG